MLSRSSQLILEGEFDCEKIKITGISGRIPQPKTWRSGFPISAAQLIWCVNPGNT